jgi:hypothetical protein
MNLTACFILGTAAAAVGQLCTWRVHNTCITMSGVCVSAAAQHPLCSAELTFACTACCICNLQAAFEHCVRAYVIRCECVPLGPGHPDTAAAGHNLGVVLDCLGKSSRGLQLVEQAQQVRQTGVPLDVCVLVLLRVCAAVHNAETHDPGIEQQRDLACQ